jgi:methylmalonyl-CoA mutase N-terminal domain/subunit
MEKGAFDYFDKLDAMGGMVKAIERGYPQKEIAEASTSSSARSKPRKRSSSA